MTSTLPPVGMIQTVLGPLDPCDAGHTQVHEHILKYKPDHVFRDDGPASLQVPLDIEITLENRKWIRRNRTRVRDAITFDDALEGLHLYRQWGGGTMVDSSSIGLGRDPVGLARIARSTGVNVVMGGGHYIKKHHPSEVATAPVERLAEAMITDVCEGVDRTGVRSGMLGEIGLSWPVHPDEAKCLRAAAAAQAATGVCLQIHPGRHPDAALDAVRRAEAAGASPERIMMSHVERTLPDVESMAELAKTGCYLAFDLFGQEASWYEHDPSFDMPNDATRLNYMRSLTDVGFGEQLVMSQDLGHAVRLKKYGGEGYHHILEMVVPVMRRKGLDVDLVLHANPARALTVAR